VSQLTRGCSAGAVVIVALQSGVGPSEPRVSVAAAPPPASKTHGTESRTHRTKMCNSVDVMSVFSGFASMGYRDKENNYTNDNYLQ